MRKIPKLNRGVRKLNRMQNRIDSGRLGERKLNRTINRQTNLQGRLQPRIDRRYDKLQNRGTKLFNQHVGGGDNENHLSPGDRGYNRVKNRYDRVAGRMKKLYPWTSQHAAANTPQVATPEEVPEGIYPNEEGFPGPYEENVNAENNPVDYQAQMDELMKGLFPTTTINDAHEYYQKGMQPLLDYTQGRQDKQMEQYFASRGLTGSGFEAQQFQDANSQLQGNFNKMAMDYAENDMSRRQQAADRLYGLMRDEADRAQRGEEHQWQKMYDSLNLMAQQSPLQYGYDAASTSAQLANQHGENIGALLSSQYPQMPPTSAFPGPGPMPPYVPPLTPPSNTTGQFYETVGNQASTGQDISAIWNIISQFM
jgi:hypothetical protein